MEKTNFTSIRANANNKTTSGSTQKAASSNDFFAGGGAASSATIAGNCTTSGFVAGGAAASGATTTGNASSNVASVSNSSDNSAIADANQGRIHKTILRGKAGQVVQRAGGFLESNEKADFAVVSKTQQSTVYSAPDIREAKITSKLLMAVVYGMESREVNQPPSDADIPNVFYVPDITEKNNAPKKLFNRDLYAKDLLERSPEFLLHRGDVTDWAGRTFKDITAFEYAVWAKDFKMIEMMLGCIPSTVKGDYIRSQLLEQIKQVRAPIYAGGGLSYTITYKRPRVDANGIPTTDAEGILQDDVVTEEHTENHFNSAPLMQAYQDYENYFETLDWGQREEFWVMIIRTLQCLLPVHILQRYCDPGVPFDPLPQFNRPFRRSTTLYDFMNNDEDTEIFTSQFSSDFGNAACWADRVDAYWPEAEIDSLAIRRLDEVSTNEMNNVIQRLNDELLRAQHTGGFQP